MEIFPDVIPALKILAFRFKLVALSNGNAEVKRLDLNRFFTAQINAGEFGIRKLDKAIFHKACEILDSNPESVLHVGDHPTDDLIGTEQAGLQSVWINRFGNEWPYEKQTSVELRDLNELVELLAEI